MRYALKPGFQFRPEDLVQVPDGEPMPADLAPLPERVLPFEVAPAAPRARRAGPEASAGQGRLDLRAKPRRPWEDAHPKVTKPFNLRPTEELHAKLKWLAEHMPNTSMQKIAMQGIEEIVDRLIAVYDTPERD
ncbi:hypothetical protein [Paraburkholderia sp. C35]|uniref:hypothetical protein n=1 Tax=Paraburkholderia sp. C35 TaxID=2126993 RepID=UPI000D69ECE4|nr:hypothetical protein [Paraburkholderia sp. C35]